jgi:hypothetical protein
MKGYKVFNPDLTCRGFQYEIGKTYYHEGEVIPCRSGFHFCEKADDCFRYYVFDSSNIVCEVEASGEVIEHGSKHVTNTLTIVKQLSWYEVLDVANTGKGNSGYGNAGGYNSGSDNSGHYNSGYNNLGNRNSGDYNSGDYNSGNNNSGDHNTGNHNSGDYNSGSDNSGDNNSGDHNTGNHNAGDYNAGYYNSGDFNSGDYNAGDFNASNHQTGSFNSIQENVRLFNKPSGLTHDEWWNSEAYAILSRLYLTKGKNGETVTIGYKEAWGNLWNSLDDKEKTIIQAIPNFDKDVFFDITGIEIK